VYKALEDLTNQLRWTQRALWTLAASVLVAALTIGCQDTHEPAEAVIVRTRRVTIILVAAAALALPVGAYQLGHRVEGNTNLRADNCLRIHPSWTRSIRSSSTGGRPRPV
jgi:hypothetical protein